MTAGEQRHLQRAHALFEQGRYDLAERSVQEHLATEPDDGWAHALYALTLLNLGRLKEADRESAAALVAAPDIPLSHMARAWVCVRLGRSEEALSHAATALERNPTSGEAFRVVAVVRFDQRRWNEALAATDQGLALAPEDADLQAMRSRILTQLGRRDEAAAAIEGTLRLDPENAHAHVSQGFRQLHEREHAAAMESFREALRLDPNAETARVGMLEAMKARNPVYALFLRYFLWTSRLGPRAAVLLFVGYFALNRASRFLAENPGTQLLGTTLLAVLILFAWSTFAAVPLFNLVLMLDPLGRHALQRRERTEATLVGALIVIALLAFVAGLVGIAGDGTLWPIAVTAAGLVIPVHVAFAVRGTWQVAVPVGIAAVMVLLGLYSLVTYLGGQSGFTAMIGVFLLAAVTTWVAPIVQAKSRPD